MSLKLTNQATHKQIEWLKNNEYYGRLNLTFTEAEKLIDELMEQRKQKAKRPEQLYYDRFKQING